MEKRHHRTTNNGKSALIIGCILTALWVIGIIVAFYALPNLAKELKYDNSMTALVLIAMIIPIALIWTAVLLSRSMARMMSQTVVLQKSVERMRQTLDIQIAEQSETRDRWIQSQLAQITELTKQTDDRVSALAEKTFDDRNIPSAELRNIPALNYKKDNSDDSQSHLAFPTNDAETTIIIPEFIKALNFPDNANDTEGFRVLRDAFNDPKLAKVLQSSQDILTMLSQDGIYMDDLRIETPAASAWRSFIEGKRGIDVSALGMVRDRTALSLSKTRLKNDIAFKETAHHFLTQFIDILENFGKNANDAELAELGKTRSAVAFMLLGRVSDIF